MISQIRPLFVGIAGGTGAGKSTACRKLQKQFPSLIGILQIDNYWRPATRVPKLHGMLNWDHPDALDFVRLESDLQRLFEGKPIIVKAFRTGAVGQYRGMKHFLRIQIAPRPVMLVEGHLALHHPNIRRFFSTAVWLDAPHQKRWRRRVHFKSTDYERVVLIRMQRKYLQPTREFAAHVIDTGRLTIAQTSDSLIRILRSDAVL